MIIRKKKNLQDSKGLATVLIRGRVTYQEKAGEKGSTSPITFGGGDFKKKRGVFRYAQHDTREKKEDRGDEKGKDVGRGR